ncbi:MAG: hypothetical protein Kow00121_56960 [Elainellaceae cyanobacterium]
MSQKLWSGITAATLLVATLGVAPISYADQSRSEDGLSEAQVPTEPASSEVASTASDASEPASNEVVKVGEYQSEEQTESEETITEMVPHEMEGRPAVTLYVRDIPVLTFLGSSSTASTVDSAESANAPVEEPEVKFASIQNHSQTISATGRLAAQPNQASSRTAGTENAQQDPNDPLWRATTIAARLNQLHRDNIDASTITATWDSEQQAYVIKVGEDELVEIDADTILPNTTQNEAEDALQATNLLRRQLGAAPPLQSISGDPRDRPNQISLGPIQVTISGMASWYGPGFDGAYSASGEVFNQYAMTAAHRTLPFGTQVRVTNVDNGMSVVVRINDRGPFHGNRVIDLSTAAAQAIGIVQAGVAPVNVEVIDSP